MNTLSVNQRILIAAFVGFVVGVGSVLVWDFGKIEPLGDKGKSLTEEQMSDTDNESTEKTAPILIGETDSVDIDDQNAGSFVKITSVTLGRPGWVVIHEDSNGKLGNALGAQLYREGWSIGTVELLRNTVAGNTYFAVLYNDNGNKAFELGVDAMIVDTDQNPTMDSFKVY